MRLTRVSSGQVKQIMEEAVTRKFVHEDSSHIISLCGAVEGCLLHGLRRRAAGFLRSDKTAALFTKLGKVFPPAAELCRKVHEVESRNDRRGHQSLSQDSSKKGGGLGKGGGGGLSPTTLKHVWVRTALFERVLDKIAQYLVDNACKYYEKEALLMDPVDGAILASLLVGPCALEYTKMKTADHFWTDPSADELVQRHRIHSGHSRAESPSKRPALNISLTEQIRKRHSSGSVSDERATLLSARDYVESLHQNSRATLLYGKNNVLVQPKEDTEVIPGYLSLHQTAENLTLKWTPNQLMNGSLGDGELEKSVYWDYAITVHMEDIVYLHCHQQPDNGGTVVLVSQDGVQRPPLHFPQGGHLLAFLSCMENGLLPRGQLDPPLWSQRGKGKVFPKLKRRSCRGRPPDGEGEDEATDYVFRITYPSMRSENVPPDLLELHGGGMQAVLSWQLEGSTRRGSCSCSPAATPPDARSSSLITCAHDRAPLKLLCETMKRQILSRAFYGWLAYCRHLSTVRTHLSALINHDMIPAAGAREGLTPLVWQQYMSDSKSISEEELLRLVYYGGVDHSLRHQVWPYLLGHYKFGMTERERRETDEVTRALYEHTMAEWLACEAIVRQRERESHAAALAKLSSGSSIDSHVRQLIHRDSSISNEVFESVDEVEGSAGRDAAAAAAAAGTKAGGAVKLGVKRVPDSPDSGLPSSRNFSLASSSRGTTAGSFSLDDNGTESGGGGGGSRDPAADKDKEPAPDCASTSNNLDAPGVLPCDAVSPASSTGATYTTELLDTYALNLHRIEKDVQRCDRNFWYFTAANLDKLRNIMCSYVWEHLEVGYVQGMCDILAPLLVILDDEALAYSCFTEMMKRMTLNFPHGGVMDTHFANMRSLIQILDPEMFELMVQNGDYTHFYFCYRWFLLDFKRELLYDDVFAVWEVIWAARRVSSAHFVLFIALAMVELYRDIILHNSMDFTDIIKFFNEMAEHHDAQVVLRTARELVNQVQTLVVNK
ncbi:unnamed protein product [Lampetra planeri]